MLTRESFVAVFKDIGNHWDLKDELIVGFENFACKLYRCKTVEVKKARYEQKKKEKFQKKYTKENKIIDLALLPPCHYRRGLLESLQLYSMLLESLSFIKSRYPNTLPIRMDIRVRDSVAR